MILLPGKIKPKSLASAQEEYIRRLRPFGVDIQEYKDAQVSSRTPEQTKETEAERIFSLVKKEDYLVACDERGKPVRTPELAELITTGRQGGGALAGKRRLVIVIGGALGLSDSVRCKADAIWSLSSMVMAGGVARLVLLEGVYRAMTIVQGHPYHNE
ncbi:MAG TPA: 23S rRNA (pseudouridine(1915)-N(3))-methyltransferase RlmH [Pontiella sp.]